MNSIPEGVLIAAFAWLLLRLSGRQNSGTRFAVWFVALLAIVALPLMPAVHVGGAIGRAVHAEVTLPGSWAAVIFGLWVTIALVATVRLALGLWRVRALRRSALALPDPDPVVRGTIEQCQAIRPVKVCTSTQVRVPAAIGFFQPVILIPTWAVAELSSDELRAIILHEFAHLRRWDDWTNLLQKVVCGVFFFHPAVLWIERQLSLEREMACDDAVLAETENPHLYARCLVSLAERSFLRRSIAVAQAAISRAKDTSRRLAQILDVERPKATRVFGPAVAAVVAFAGLCFVAIPNGPRLVAFTSMAPVVKPDAAPSLAASTPAIEPSISALPKELVIPASLHERRAELSPAKLKLAKKRVRVSSSPVRQQVARQMPAVPNSMVVRASAKQAPRPLSQYLVFTQSTEFFRDGSTVMTYSVWRVMLVTRSTASKPPNQT
ncbi:MAG TPA: M56 family metallopeptidase [Terriglobales bacterium]|nr:M56 family metallopeptidase [Terriglobales bacterium]